MITSEQTPIKAKDKVDFERASLLMNFIVQAGQHGPLYQVLAGKAQEELKKMVEDTERGDKVVTPAEGPANSAIQHPDGSIEKLPPGPTSQPNPAVDQARDEAARREPDLRHDREPSKRIFPEGSGVREEHDPPIVQRKV